MFAVQCFIIHGVGDLLIYYRAQQTANLSPEKRVVKLVCLVCVFTNTGLRNGVFV